jgi:hypothetical protein
MRHLTPQNSQATSPLLEDVFAMRDDLLDNTNEDNAANSLPDILPGDLSDAFSLLDPDLALLHKDMKTAAAQMAHAKKTGGQMADIALWRFQTAESAYQTRLMEVRKNKIAQETAQTALSKGESEARKQLHALSMQEKMNEHLNLQRKQRLEKKRREEEKQGGFFFYILLGMWLAQMNQKRRLHNFGFSSLQSAFFDARTA